mmetsp:Transcript_88848/g.139172  ORF Transcript_88848/g.139172 Transcript_88848/m.139172 type:complete len:106 (-) Transcript_88848:1115-1432(-)
MIHSAAPKKAISVEPRWSDVADIVAVAYMPVNKKAIINTNLVKFRWMADMVSTFPITPVTRQNTPQVTLHKAAIPGAIQHSHHNVAAVVHAVFISAFASLPSVSK